MDRSAGIGLAAGASLVGSAASASTSTALRSTTTTDTDAEPITIETVDDLLDAPQVNCARGVCVIDETEPEVCEFDENMEEIVCVPAETPLWPKALLLGSSVLYGTNFALGRLMNDALPAAAASTSARFVLAGVALFPFLLRLAPNLRRDALICGCFTALGYVTQSLALVDTPAATVAFLGALTVVVCPTCAFLVEKRTDLGFRDAPQVWVAAILALVGVGFLELPSVLAGGGDLLSAGDALSVLQAVGFGTSFYLTERMMQKEPTQALSITAAQVSVTAFISAVWAFCDGYGLGPFDGAGCWTIRRERRTRSPGCSWTLHCARSPRRRRGPVWSQLQRTASPRRRRWARSRRRKLLYY